MRPTAPKSAGPPLTAGGSRWGRTLFESLKVPQFRRFMASHLCAAVAFQSNGIAKGWLAFDLSQDARSLGLVLFLYGVAMGVGTLIGGVLADRVSRWAVIVVVQSVMAAFSVIMALVLVLDLIELWHLYASSVVMGFVSALHLPARQAFVYNVAGERYLANALAIGVMTSNVMRMVAPVIAGVLIGTVGIESVYLMIAAGYLGSVMVMLFLLGPTTQERAASEKEPALRSIAEGFRYVWRQRTLFWLTMAALGGTVIGLPFRDLLPAFAVDALGQEPEGFGLMLGMVGAGALIGGLGMAALVQVSFRGWLVLGLGVVWGAFMVLFSQIGSIGAALPVLVVLGWTSVSYTTFINIIMQTKVDDAFRGRVASMYILGFAIHPVGALAFGAIARESGIRTPTSSRGSPWWPSFWRWVSGARTCAPPKPELSP